jgi:hypothetical protein
MNRTEHCGKNVRAIDERLDAVALGKRPANQSVHTGSKSRVSHRIFHRHQFANRFAREKIKNAPGNRQQRK